jgi:uncharacterized protein (TIGR02996 family)
VTDKEALLRSVLLDPAADNARLIYAEYIEEHEPERAEFVRVQVELANLGCDAEPHHVTIHGEHCRPLGNNLTTCEVLGKRAKSLWLMSLGWSFPFVGEYDWFSRGFVSEVRLPLAAFLAHAGALFAAHPVTAVRLTDREPHAAHVPGNFWWFRSLQQGPAVATIPDVLWESDSISRTVPHYRVSRHFPTRAAALDALSAACVAYGRSLAGLPPLKSALTPAAAR